MQAVAVVQSSHSSASVISSSSARSKAEAEPPLKKWKYLAAKQRAAAVTITVPFTPQSEVNRYLIELRSSTPVSDALTFWQKRRKVYTYLIPLAEVLVSASASQAFVERIFSVCACSQQAVAIEWRNHWRRVYFLRMNAHIID